MDILFIISHNVSLFGLIYALLLCYVPFGGYNPGGSTACTIMGILFYSAEIAAGAYITCFSIALRKAFYAPINSLLKDMKFKTCSKILQ